MSSDAEHMREAIALASANVAAGGGPFGCVVVKDGQVVGRGANRVVPDHDPTAHAEVNALRDAARRLGTHDLAGCQVYSSCEPCPMCLAALYWARVDSIYYGNTQADAADIDFDDSYIYSQLSLPMHLRSLPMRRLLGHEAIESFHLWRASADKTPY